MKILICFVFIILYNYRVTNYIIIQSEYSNKNLKNLIFIHIWTYGINLKCVL